MAPQRGDPVPEIRLIGALNDDDTSVVFAPPDAPEAGQRSRTRAPDQIVRYERRRHNDNTRAIVLRYTRSNTSLILFLVAAGPPDSRTPLPDNGAGLGSIRLITQRPNNAK